MMGPRQVEQGALFYNFSLDAHVPADHLLRSIDRFVDLARLRRELAPYYSQTGRPSVDPELMIRIRALKASGVEHVRVVLTKGGDVAEEAPPPASTWLDKPEPEQKPERIIIY